MAETSDVHSEYSAYSDGSDASCVSDADWDDNGKRKRRGNSSTFCWEFLVGGMRNDVFMESSYNSQVRYGGFHDIEYGFYNKKNVQCFQLDGRILAAERAILFSRKCSRISAKALLRCA